MKVSECVDRYKEKFEGYNEEMGKEAKVFLRKQLLLWTPTVGKFARIYANMMTDFADMVEEIQECEDYEANIEVAFE